MKLKITLIILISAISISAFSQYAKSHEIEGVQHLTIESKILDETRELFIYIPEVDNVKDLPVFYLLDGEMKLRYEWVIEEMENYPHILVGIESRKNRRRDMFPFVMESRPGTGGGKNFLKFLTTELQPYINKKYPNNGKTVLYGGSNAGLFTFYAMFNKPESFNYYIPNAAMIGHGAKYMHDLLVNAKNKNFDNTICFSYYGEQDHYTQVTIDLPVFHDKIKQLFPKMHFKYMSDKNGEHVPRGGVRLGLEYIYNR